MPDFPSQLEKHPIFFLFCLFCICIHKRNCPLIPPRHTWRKVPRPQVRGRGGAILWVPSPSQERAGLKGWAGCSPVSRRKLHHIQGAVWCPWSRTAATPAAAALLRLRGRAASASQGQIGPWRYVKQQLISAGHWPGACEPATVLQAFTLTSEGQMTKLFLGTYSLYFQKSPLKGQPNISQNSSSLGKREFRRDCCHDSSLSSSSSHHSAPSTLASWLFPGHWPTSASGTLNVLYALLKCSSSKICPKLASSPPLSKCHLPSLD